jgi:hypothetical protein
VEVIGMTNTLAYYYTATITTVKALHYVLLVQSFLVKSTLSINKVFLSLGACIHSDSIKVCFLINRNGNDNNDPLGNEILRSLTDAPGIGTTCLDDLPDW